MRWILGILVLVIGVGTVLYLNGWQLAAQVLPLIERAQQVPAPPATAFAVPEGFAVSVFADQVPGARVMVRDPRGTLVVSQTREGAVVALPDEDGDHRADRVITILDGLDSPHGLAFIGDTLYVAEEGRVVAYRYDAAARTAVPIRTLLTLPTGGGHTTRTIMPTPDMAGLYVSVGSSCNVCVEEDPRRAAILAVDVQTGASRVYATGLRNAVFMAYEQITGDLWVTEMGRDLLGDNVPPDELNRVVQGGNYGWPICYGKNVHDTAFDTNTYVRPPCEEPQTLPSLVDIPAHSAPLGIVFVPEEGWPEEYWYDALVAYHGSWNRSEPAGYAVARIAVNERGQPTGETSDFMTGFMQNGEVIGRPAGLLIEPGGVLWVSDDRAGAVYRVYRGPSGAVQ